MAHIITLRGTQITFPPVCMVCLKEARQSYRLTRAIRYGSRSIPLSLPIPLCAEHYALAARRAPAERLVARLGGVLGLAAGLAIALLLLNTWSANQPGGTVLILFSTLFASLSAFTLVWIVFSYILAPRFASQETTSVRNAVQILSYRPSSQELQLAFANEAAAAQVMAANSGKFISEPVE